MSHALKPSILLIVLLSLSNCGTSDSTDSGNGGALNGIAYTFKVKDNQFVNVADVKVFLNEETSPRLTSDQNGKFTIYLENGDYFHLKKNGYQMRSFYKSNWDDSSNNIVTLPAQGPTLSGTIQGNIAIPIADVSGVFLSASTGSISTSIPVDANTDPNFSMGLSSTGTIDLVAIPGPLDIAPADAYWGLTKNVPIIDGGTTSADVALKMGGKQFSLTVTGGLTSNSGLPENLIQAGYQIYKHPNLKSFLTINASYLYGVESINKQITTIPNSIANNEIYANLYLQSSVGFVDRGLKVLFQSVDELNNAATEQTFVLQDFGLSLSSPQHLEVLAGSRPTFTWSYADDAVTSVTLILYGPNSSSSDTIWVAKTDSSVTSIKYPSNAPTLVPRATYDLLIRAAKQEFDAAGNLIKSYTNTNRGTSFSIASP